MLCQLFRGFKFLGRGSSLMSPALNTNHTYSGVYMFSLYEYSTCLAITREQNKANDVDCLDDLKTFPPIRVKMPQTTTLTSQREENTNTKERIAAWILVDDNPKSRPLAYHDFCDRLAFVRYRIGVVRFGTFHKASKENHLKPPT